MGDLIIKPESGGSIKIQNYAGSNALVSDNSGNVTLAGTANNLGTITAGTIGSTVTFPAGHIINAVLLSDSNRHVLSTSGSSPASTADFGSYTKLLASSTLHFISTVIGYDDSSGVCQLGIRYGSGTITYSGSWTYDEGAYNKLLQCQMALVGHTTTGAQNVEMVHKASNNSGNNPCVVVNPSSSDESRFGDQVSTCIVYEIAT